MKLTTLAVVYNCVNGSGGEEIQLSYKEIVGARKCIDEMLRLGNE
jgi:quinolinate synthase